MSVRKPDNGMGLTRIRDLLLIGGVAFVVGYALTRWNYARLPTLPRLAGISAAILGIGEAFAGFNIRMRIQQYSNRSARPGGTAGQRNLKPIPPLVAARAVLVAKASSLAASGVAGLWLGVLLYVAPNSGMVTAAGQDTVTAIIGLVGALIMAAGALWLERCCLRPDDDDRGGSDHQGSRGIDY